MLDETVSVKIIYVFYCYVIIARGRAGLHFAVEVQALTTVVNRNVVWSENFAVRNKNGGPGNYLHPAHCCEKGHYTGKSEEINPE
jgi:hypothetical protein